MPGQARRSDVGSTAESDPADSDAQVDAPSEPERAEEPAEPVSEEVSQPQGEEHDTDEAGSLPVEVVAPAEETFERVRWSDRRRLVAQRLRQSSGPAIVVGLLLVGASLSYLIAPRSVDQTVEVMPPGLLATGQGEATMPGLVGMDLSAGRVALLDAYVDTSMIELIREGAAGSPNRILAQDPEPGVGVQGKIYLTISTPITTPNLVGLDFKAATRAIEKLGGAVRLEQVVEPGSVAGTVLSTVPKRGKRLTAVSTLRVADPGTPVPLAELSATDESGCSSAGEITVSGKHVSSGISCELYDEPAYTEYSTNGVAAAFRATVGLDDDNGSGRAEVRILTDGTTTRVLAVRRGAPIEVLIPLKGVDTVRIEVTGSASDEDETAYVVLGDAAFSLLPEDVGILTAGDS